jgi:hypothetical protein
MHITLENDFSNEEIARKRQTLAALKVKIRLLKDQLEAAENEQKLLEAQLNPILGRNTYKNIEDHHLPTEILLDFFRHALPGRSHPSIRNLLLVCRRWYNIITDEPKLWAVIHLRLGIRRPSLRRNIAYYNTCVKRSRSLPLYLTIDALKFSYAISDAEMSDEDRDPTDRIDLAESTDRDPFIAALLGNGGCIVSRWREFTLLLRKHGHNYQFFHPIFASATSMASDLQLFNLVNAHVHPVIDFQHFVADSSITSIYVHEKLLTAFRPRFSHLRCADITYRATTWYPLELNQMPQLNHLTLRTTWERVDYIVPDQPISLPFLHSLSLEGYFTEDSFYEFQLPLLRRLTFISHKNISLSTALDVMPTELGWETRVPNLMPYIDETFSADLGQLLGKYNTVKTIEVPLVAGGVVMDAIQTLCEDGAISIDILSANNIEPGTLSISINDRQMVRT